MEERGGKEILADLSELVQEFASYLEGRGVVVTASMLVWDQTEFTDDGQVSTLKYTLPTDLSYSTALGLARGASLMVESEFNEAVSSGE